MTPPRPQRRVLTPELEALRVRLATSANLTPAQARLLAELTVLSSMRDLPTDTADQIVTETRQIEKAHVIRSLGPSGTCPYCGR